MVRSVAGNLPEQVKNNQSVNTAAGNGGQKMSQYSWFTVYQTTITTLLQENTNVSMQGRIFGFMGAMYAICYPFGMVVFGPLADIISLQWIMISSGIILLLMPIFLYINKSLNGL